jgi:hypothetical protein
MDLVLNRVTAGDPDLSGVDPRIAPLLYAALAPDPQDRPHQRDVVAALERYAHGGLVTDVIQARPPVPPVQATQSFAVPPTSVMPLSRTGIQPRPMQAPAVALQGAPQLAPVTPLRQVAPQRQDPADAIFGPRDGQLEPGEQRLDPRIGRPSRSGTVAALLALLVATAVTVPVVAAAALLLWLTLARATDRSVTSLIVRRHDRGPRRSDMPVAVLMTPWHLLLGLLTSIFGAIMPALLAVSGVFCAALAVVAVQGTGSPEPNALVPMGVGGLLAGLMAWWGPGGASLRRGTRSILRGVSPGPSASRVVVLLLLVAAAAVAAAGIVDGEPSWWPTGTAWADQLNLP